MAHYVYYTANGVLYSSTVEDTDPVAPPEILAAQGMTVVSGLPPLSNTIAWDVINRTTKTVIPPPPPAPTKFIPTFEFILLFSPSEHDAIISSTDSRVRQFLMALNVTPQIDLLSPTIQNGINYLASLGLISTNNATLILSGQASQ